MRLSRAVIPRRYRWNVRHTTLRLDLWAVGGTAVKRRLVHWGDNLRDAATIASYCARYLLDLEQRELRALRDRPEREGRT